MKKITYFLGYLFAVTFLIGSYLKLAHLDNANLFILTGITGFTVLYLPIVLFNNKNVSTKSAVIWITVASLYALLFWWELLRWSGAGEMITLGTLFLIVGVLPYFFFRQYKNSIQHA